MDRDTQAVLLARRLKTARTDIDTAKRALAAARDEHDDAVLAIHEAGFSQVVIWKLAEALDDSGAEAGEWESW